MDLKRKSRGFREFLRILVTCEGSKTEPNYFRSLCRGLGLRATVVEIAGANSGSAPESVYQYAAKRLAEDPELDELYCVFDRDQHESFDSAMKKITEHPSKKLRAVVSYPCFEFWILLHFRFSRAPFSRVGAESAGDMAAKAVKTEWPSYAKGALDVFERLDAEGRTDIAIANAARARKDASETGELNPSTDVDELVSRLREVAKLQQEQFR